jgi:hypothetical protein
MLRLDLEVAEIAYSVPGPDGPLFADFHALRHSYITALGRGGVDLRTAQELAGHSTPVLTARYSHRRLYDLADAVEKLPRFLPEQLGTEAVLSATGTDGPGFGCSLVAQPPDRAMHLQASAGVGQRPGRGGRETAQPGLSPGLRHRLASPDIASLKGG